MGFVRLTHDLLRDLKSQGYNILHSPTPSSSDDLAWYPERVDDIWNYLDHLMCTPFQEPNIIIIEEILRNINQENLAGSVWLRAKPTAENKNGQNA